MTEIKLLPVKSSAIEAIGYDAPKSELHVRFHGGSTHIYSRVSSDAHVALVSARSIGKHFSKHIRSHPAREAK